GSTSFSDAFLPLALLSFGQAQNFLWWWQINHLIAPFVAMSLLLFVLMPKSLTFRRKVLAGLCMLILPFSGADVLPYALALAPWVSYQGILACKSPDPHAMRNGLIVVSMVIVSLACVGFYFVNYTPSQGLLPGVVVDAPGWRA